MYILKQRGQIIFRGSAFECLDRLININKQWTLLQARNKGYRIERGVTK